MILNYEITLFNKIYKKENNAVAKNEFDTIKALVL